MKNKYILGILLISIIILIPQLVIAEEEDGPEDLMFFGLEVEKLLAYIGAHLAAVLAILTFIAYKRSNKSRLLFVTFAFVIFSIKLFLISSELYINEIAYVGTITSFLDFIILLSFFLGIVKK